MQNPDSNSIANLRESVFAEDKPNFIHEKFLDYVGKTPKGGRNFDIVYCLSSSIQYNLTKKDLRKTIDSMRRHAIEGKVIFDLAYCAERWKEGYTNITANSDERFDVAELYTSHSNDGFSYWNPLYLIKDKKTGKMDMHVDKHKIKLWNISEVREILSSQKIPFKLKKGYSEIEDENGVPIFILEGL